MLILFALLQLAPSEDVDPMALARAVYEAVVSGQWWMAASIAVVLLVWAIRTWGARLFPKLAGALANPIVSFALPVLVSAAGAVTTSLIAGMPIQVALLAALKVAAGAVFAYVFARKLSEAKAAGEAASAEIKTSSDAAALLRGPKP